MIKMTFAEYDKMMAGFEVMESPSHNYGLTDKDLAKMEADPEKYLIFAMYLLTRDWYMDRGDFSHEFDNLDAEKCVNVNYRLNELLKDALYLYDEEDELDAAV